MPTLCTCGDEGDPVDGPEGYILSVPALDGKWGECHLEVLDMPLVIPTTPPKGPSHVIIPEGTWANRPMRWYVDQTIFRVRRRVRGPRGTILVDASGSTRFSAPRLAPVLEVAPGMLVACYAGDHHTGVGCLHVVAKKGRRAIDKAIGKPHHYDNNVVDGPALAWLADAPPPRYWVSDGAVHGVNRLVTPAMMRDVATLCRAAHITRVPTLDEMLSRLAKR